VFASAMTRCSETRAGVPLVRGTLNRIGASRIAKIAFSVKVICLVTILGSPSPLNAQSFYGSILGTITDTSGAVVPDATVRVTNIGTNEAQTVQSDSEGKYVVANLAPTGYRVEMTKAQFQRFFSDQVIVGVGAFVRVDGVLVVGTINETIKVNSEAPLLQTDTSAMSEEIDRAQVRELPLNGRNVMNLIALAPGVVPGGSSAGGTGLNQGTRTGNQGWGNYQIGGAIQGQSAEYIDGSPINVLGGNTVALVMTQDAVQEFSVVTGGAGADFGRFAGGVVNMTSRSGTNEWHGSVYEYFRNADLNANNFFNNLLGAPRPQDNQNQYGVVLNGPIKKDAAFVFFSWEGFAEILGESSATNVPTQAMRNGVFTNPITDPLGNCNIVHNPTAGTWTITNLWQGACGDPLAHILMNYYPLPNTSGAFNWFLTTPITNHQNQYNARVDYTIGRKQRLFGRYTYWTLHDTGFSEFNNAGGWPTANGHVINHSQQAVLGDTYTFSPSTLLDVRVTYVREYSPNYPESVAVNQSQFGPAYAALAPQMSIHVLPVFTLNGIHNFYNFGNIAGYSVNWWNTYGTNVNLIKIIGGHSLKLGTELRLMDQSGTGFVGDGSGKYTYSTTYTGDEWASFLMGYPTQIEFSTFSTTASYNYYQAYYVTDIWQAKRNLTVNLGLRYELPGAVAERNNKATVLLPHAVDPYTGATGTLTLVDSPLYPHRSTVLPKHDLFAPRLGFAYRLNNETAIRGGYGISYLPPDLTGELATSSLVNSASTQINVTGALPTPLQDLYPETLNQPIGRTDPSFMTLYCCTASLKNISGPVPWQNFAYVQQWNFTVGHQFKGNWMAEVGYSGLKGTNLPGIGLSLDELSSKYYAMGSALLNPTTLDGIPMTVGQSLRPYPFYSNISDTAEFYAHSNYNSLQAKLVKRFGSGGTLSANYTWSKNLANTDTLNGFLEAKPSPQSSTSGEGTIQDYNNLNGEYSLLSYNVNQRAVISYVLDLPLGKGQRFANRLSRPVDMLVSGWSVSGITTFQSGFPLFITEAQSNPLTQFFGGGALRPNVVAGCHKKISGSATSRLNEWFNTSCFTFPGNYAFGNESRVDPTLTSQGINNYDFAAMKSTNLWGEQANVQFRAEFFNIFNRVQFAPPVTQQGSSNFGEILSQVNQPREIQFSLRINF
jgi:Carboxypeptidase regulatory-like domain/TonB dependent receptor